MKAREAARPSPPPCLVVSLRNRLNLSVLSISISKDDIANQEQFVDVIYLDTVTYKPTTLNGNNIDIYIFIVLIVGV